LNLIRVMPALGTEHIYPQRREAFRKQAGFLAAGPIAIATVRKAAVLSALVLCSHLADLRMAL
jgi:hypothetical protein